MKIVSWNVNGLRSAENAFLEFINKYSPDIIMLQEVRAHENQLSFFLRFIEGYDVKFNYSERPGYSGTAIYSKKNLKLNPSNRTEYGVLDKEGRVQYCDIGETRIFNFYTPNGTSSVERLRFKLDYYWDMKEYFKELVSEGRQVIIGGDLNVAHTELDLYSPRTAKNTSGFLEPERQWFDDVLSLEFSDSFRLFQKQGGYYSWWHMRDPKRELNRGWRFDYFLVSDGLKNDITEASILKDVFGSDHCPITLSVDL